MHTALSREDLPRDRLVNTAAVVMTITHLLQVLVFSFLGFAFAPHLPLIAGMIVAVSLGSYVGTRLRGRLSESLFRRIFKGGGRHHPGPAHDHQRFAVRDDS